MRSIRRDDGNQSGANGSGRAVDGQFQFALDHLVDFLLRVEVLVDRRAAREAVVREGHVFGMEIASMPAGQALNLIESSQIDPKELARLKKKIEAAL